MDSKYSGKCQTRPISSPACTPIIVGLFSLYIRSLLTLVRTSEKQTSLPRAVEAVAFFLIFFIFISLSKAVYQGALEAVTLLLLHGADPNLVSSEGNQRALARNLFPFFFQRESFLQTSKYLS